MTAASFDALLSVTFVSLTIVTRAAPCRRWPSRVRNRKPSGAEAPRPARERIDGRSPGLRVAARHRLPGLSQWPCGTGSPLTVAGAAADLEAFLPHRIPYCLSSERPSTPVT